MTLVVEDGTGKADAESYVTVSAFKTWATNRGYVLPSADVEIESLLRKGCDFIERKLFVGEQEFAAQALAFPRLVEDVNFSEATTGIPNKLKTAQMLLAMESMNGALTAAARGSKYTATKIDQIYFKYANPSNASGDLFFPAIDDLLAEWTINSGKIRTVRA